MVLSVLLHEDEECDEWIFSLEIDVNSILEKYLHRIIFAKVVWDHNTA